MKPIAFWTWFQDNQEKLFILPLLTMVEQQEHYYWLNKHLDDYCKGLGFKIKFTKDYNSTAKFIITAYGVKELFPKVNKLIEVAPKIDNWKFEAFIKPKENQNFDHPYKFANLEIYVNDLSFQPVKYIKSTGKLIIHIYFDKKNRSLVAQRSNLDNPINPKDLNTAITFILEDLLGEVLLYAKIKKFKLYKNNRNRGITYKLTHLKTYLSLINQN